MVLLEKNLEFFQSRSMWHFVLECLSNGFFPGSVFFHLNCEVFLAKIQKIFKVEEIRKSDEETEYFEKKNASIF